MSRDFKPGIKITRTADISRHYWFPRELTSGERAQKARRKHSIRLTVSKLSLCHWSSQLFGLRVPLSTDVPVLLLNQPDNILMTCRYPDLSGAPDWSCIVGNFLEPIKRDNRDLGSGTSSVWNFCTFFLDVISRGKPVVASQNVGCFRRP